MTAIQRALISVFDEFGIADFARQLAQRGVELLSTGGTAKQLAEHGVAVTEVADYTGFPALMDGRVKTLHPKIHGGLLGRRGVDDRAMAEHGIAPIDLLVVNLYPFQAVIANPDADLATALENIDIGGPAMLRGAAKNHAHVTVIVDPADYARVLDDMDRHGGATPATRFRLAVKAFEHTAQYDGAIANHLGRLNPDGEPRRFPDTLNLQWRRTQVMRYGENPHQHAAFYTDADPPDGSIAGARQLQGKALSYNNIADADAALACVKQFDQRPACVIVKHANPCGVACDDALPVAYDKAFATDPESAFGGIIAVNRTLDEDTAAAIIKRQFVEVIIAPDVTPQATAICAQKSAVRLLVCGPWRPAEDDRAAALDIKRVSGGLLAQTADHALYAELNVVSKRQPDAQQWQDLLFGWRVAKSVKSNAIVYAKDQRTLGVGAGQMSRVNSARIAAIKADHAGLDITGAIMASDAFFPFRDGIDRAAEAGIAAVIQPGGSRRDDDIIAAADERRIAMVFTGMRHFRH